MARVNSPAYPSMSLPKAITAIRKIFDADRRNPVDRAVAARHIGYSGPSGASDKAIAALAHYGLSEKTGKGELRVSQRALDILHPDNPSDKQRAILAAGQSPAIFKVLHERFGDHVSPDALKSYLVRENFQDAAITPLMNAYFETRRFLEQEKAFESGGINAAEGEESNSSDNDGTDEMNDAATIERPIATPQPKPLAPEQEMPSKLNRPRMDIQGDKVRLDALLDLKGLLDLEKKIPALKMLLQVYHEANDVDGEDDDA